MKKLLLSLLLALLSFFMFRGISQAGQCIYLGSSGGRDAYYDSSDVQYSGDIVSFVFYDNNACEVDELTIDYEIDCAKRMWREYGVYVEGWSEWKSIHPGAINDVARQKLCR